jgi:Stress responsive A/B Barrel Domain
MLPPGAGGGEWPGIDESGPLAKLSVERASAATAPPGDCVIRHTVSFKLRHAPGSESEGAFLRAAQVLISIPTVRRFECLRQVGQKNGFDFGFSMEFASQPDYEAYNVHPEHVRFVETRWKPEVVDFLELDYVVFEPA